MNVTSFTHTALAVRRQKRDMTKKGYEHIDGPWQILRGGRWREVITDAVIDANGKGVWVKTAISEPPLPSLVEADGKG